MEDLGSRIKQITRELKQYVETRLELTVLNVSDKVTYIIGQSIQQLFGYTILALGLVFGLVALAIYLGDVFDAEWAGYAIVGAPFFILGLIFVTVKPKSIAKRIQAQLLAELLDTKPVKEKETIELPTREIHTKDSDENV
ncbi:MAG: hypothetical protein CL670_11360 [Balneola sp.]|jgi:uncharacterized membrane protein YqjE|nr:hypothetical protein [Balneola sp.]MBE79744.1 hypothetical protein [Balneola sp.]|tara:strand:- start:627 stop:1046 length:420 start_codon:yes stop_codon:yes gene_type:complete